MTSPTTARFFRIGTAAVATALSLAALTACGTETTKSLAAAQAQKASVDAAPLDVNDPLEGASLKDLSDTSDLVVVGQVSSVRDGFSVGTGPSALEYDLFSLDVKQTLKGTDVQTVDVVIVSSAAGKPVQISGQAPAYRGAAGVWLLRRLDSSFGIDAYVLTSKGGLIPSGDGQVQVPAEHGHTVAALGEAAELGSISQVIEHLEAAPSDILKP